MYFVNAGAVTVLVDGVVSATCMHAYIIPVYEANGCVLPGPLGHDSSISVVVTMAQD